MKLMQETKTHMRAGRLCRGETTLPLFVAVSIFFVQMVVRAPYKSGSTGQVPQPVSGYNGHMYQNVTRASSGALYMAYYFPQYHIMPENKLQTQTDNESYTEWDVLRTSNKSLTPTYYYDLTDPRVMDFHDDLAHRYGVGAFIFYHFWLDNTLILSLPVDFYLLKNRKTKFLFFWDNESGFLGTQLYDKPEKHAYQLARFFLHENYLTDVDGKKPFIVYHSQTPEATLMQVMKYLEKLVEYLKNYGVDVKLGHSHQKHKDNWYIPEWAEITSEFGPHFEGGPTRADLYTYTPPTSDPDSKQEYWQGSITSWDSRPRCNSLRTKQTGCPPEVPNGQVSPTGFGELIRGILSHLHPRNLDRVITIFAWNEWTEGATLEETAEYGHDFIKQLI